MTTGKGPGKGAIQIVDVPGEFYAANDVVERASTRESGQGASRVSLTLVDGQPSDVSPSRRRRAQLVVKRAMDLSLAILGLILLGPLFFFIGLAIKLTSPGPVFFIQEREGLRGRRFGAYKFRTMYTDKCDRSGISHTLKDDPRITPLGRWLRRTSIDELPQLFNVLRGDMSLVGPRPHVAGMLAVGQPYDTVVPYYAMRHQVLPGITGWAQVNGLRGRVETLEEARARVEYDIAYVQNFSLALDLRILVKTLLTEFVTGNGD